MYLFFCEKYVKLYIEKDERRILMKKLKDFFYDKNDILIALAILIIAALLIVLSLIHI